MPPVFVPAGDINRPPYPYLNSVPCSSTSVEWPVIMANGVHVEFGIMFALRHDEVADGSAINIKTKVSAEGLEPQDKSPPTYPTFPVYIFE